MQHGVIVKNYNSYYYVQSDNKVVMCTLRGRFKKERFTLVVGDNVEYEMVGEAKGIIEKIIPRNTMLKRPMVANVNQVILTFAAVNPNINMSLIDRFLILAEMSGINTTICINKVDLINADELIPIIDVYRNIGYQVITLSAKLGVGINELRDKLYGNVSVFAGPSGVGKSTILNAVETGLQLTTGAVSEKIGRGKHTTRYAELLPLSGGGFVVDTPGFSFTEFNDIAENDLMYYFPEINAAANECKFNTCLHFKEPQCAVKKGVLDGSINELRYQSYLDVLTEIKENKKGFL